MSPTRYRCPACGNLTRFDVTITRRTRAYHHYSLSGDLSVEDPEVLNEVVEDVSCRWCGSGRAVEVLPDAAAPADAGTAADSPTADTVTSAETVTSGDSVSPPERSGG